MSPVVEFADSHCHLDFDAFDAPHASIVASARANGVQSILVPGVAPAHFQRQLDLVRAHASLRWAAGLHPWWLEAYLKHHGSDLSTVSGCEAGLDALEAAIVEALQHPSCVAVGECGLDKSLAVADEIQRHVMSRQIGIADAHAKPVILHCVGMHHVLQQSLSQHRPAHGGVVHAFSGSPELAEYYWSKGLFLGIGGTITYARARKTRAAVAAMPLEALLLETDAPDMPLCGRQGQPNTPDQLPAIARVVAELHGCSVETVARVTTANYQRLFAV